jgi:hypothetical protein
MSEHSRSAQGNTSVSHGKEIRKQALACCQFAGKTPKSEDKTFWLCLDDNGSVCAPTWTCQISLEPTEHVGVAARRAQFQTKIIKCLMRAPGKNFVLTYKSKLRNPLLIQVVVIERVFEY